MLSNEPLRRSSSDSVPSGPQPTAARPGIWVSVDGSGDSSWDGTLPADLYLSDTAVLLKLRWTGWTSRHAVGVGKVTAEGDMHTARVEAFDPKPGPCGVWFRQVRYTVTGSFDASSSSVARSAVLDVGEPESC